MTAENPPQLQRFGPLVQMYGPRAMQTLRLVILGARSRSVRDGIPMSAADQELIDVLADAVEAAGMSPSRSGGHRDVPDAATRAALVVEGVTTKEAAQMLELTPRQVRRLAPALGGHKRGGVLLVDRDAVLALANERAEREEAR